MNFRYRFFVLKRTLGGVHRAVRNRVFNIPADLDKCEQDFFDYAIGLKNGHVFRVSTCTIHGRWARFELHDTPEHNIPDVSNPKDIMKLGKFPFDRGVQVRISEIAWVADAPHGS